MLMKLSVIVKSLEVPYLQVDVGDTIRWQQRSTPVYPVLGIGDISFISSSEELAESFEGWTSHSYLSMAPRSFEDVLNEDIMEWLRVYGENQAIVAHVAAGGKYPCQRA